MRLVHAGFIGEFDPDNFDEVVVRYLLVFYVLVVMVVLLNVLIAIVSDSYDISMAKAEALYYRSRLELITETAPIASRLPKWMLPTNDEESITESITDALDDAKKDKADDPNRLNYTINAIEAIVDHSERRTGHRIDAVETELAEARKELSEMKAMLQSLIDNRGS